MREPAAHYPPAPPPPPPPHTHTLLTDLGAQCMVGHGQWFTEHGSSQLLKRHGLVHGAAKLAIAAYSVPLPGQDGWAVAVFDDLHTSNQRWSNDAETPLAWDACVKKQKGCGDSRNNNTDTQQLTFTVRSSHQTSMSN